MNALRGLFLGICLILSLQAASQPTDSLTEVPVPKYVLYRMFHDIDVGKACDSLVEAQQVAIHQAVQVLTVMDSLIKNQDSTIRTYEAAGRIQESLYENQKEATKAEAKEKKKWKLTTFIGGAIIVIITIL